MATRLYLPASGTAPLTSLAYDANWELSTSAVRRPCYTTKQNTALADTSLTWPSGTTQQWVWFQFQSPTMSTGYSWTTSDTVSMVIRCLEGANQNDSHLAYLIRVVSADGTSVRGTVGLYHSTSTEFPTTTAATRIHNARTDGASNFTSYAGDRIIIEIGLHGVTPATTASNTMRTGDPSATSDFALTEGLTTDLCPWVELSRTVTFGNASIAGVATGGGTNTVSGTLKGKGKLYGTTTGGGANTVSGTLSEYEPPASPISGSTAGGGADTVSGTLKAKGTLAGASDGVAEVSGTLHGHGQLISHTRGSELVTNHTFDDDTWWSNYSPTEVTIADNVCHYATTASKWGIYKDLATSTKTYRYTFDVSSYSAGSIRIAGGPDLSGNGSKVVIANRPWTSWIGFYAVTASTYDIDNVYVHEITDFVQGVATVSGTLTGKAYLAGASDGVADVGGTLLAKGSLAGTIAGGGADTVSGTLKGKGSLSGYSGDMRKGLVSYWKLDETSGNAIDELGGNNGTVTGATPNQSTAKLGKSYLFDADGEKIDCGNPTNLSMTTAGTVCAWVYVNAFDNYPTIVSKNNWNSDRNGYALVYSGYGPYLMFEICNGSTYEYVRTAGKITITTGWHFAIGSWDTTKGLLKLYINSPFPLKEPSTITPVSNVYNFYIGNDASGADHNFLGYIDEVFVFNRQINDRIVAELYNGGSGVAYSSWPASVGATVSGTLSEASLTEPIAGATDGVAVVSGTLKGKGRLYCYTEGAELASNNTFDTDTWWTKNTGVTIADGVAHMNGRADGYGVYKANILTVGVRYKGRFEVKNYTSGSVNIANGGDVYGEANGTYTDVFIANYDVLGVTCGDAYLDVDNFYVHQMTLTVGGVATVSGTLTAKGKLIGSTAGVATVSATLKGKGTLKGYIQAGLKNALVSFWKLDETSGSAIDSYDSNDGSVSGATQNQSGKLGTSYLFDAEADYVDMGNPTNLQLTKVGSISAWVYPNTGGGGLIVTKSDWTNDRYGYELVTHPSLHVVWFFLCGANYGNLYATTATITYDAWNLITATWDGSNVNVYVNTTSKQSAQTNPAVSNVYNFRLGKNAVSTAGFLGKIDEVGIWERALTSTEVSAIYNSGSGLAFDNFYVSASGTLKAKGSLLGAATGVASVSGTLKGKGTLKGVINPPPQGLSLSDDFESYTEGAIGGQGNWMAANSIISVYNNSGDKVVRSAESGQETGAYRTERFSYNHYAEVKLDLLNSGSGYIGPAVRAQANKYIAYYVTEVAIHAGYVINGVWTEFGSNPSVTNNVGDILKLEVNGTTVKCYRNGAIDTRLSGGGIYTAPATIVGGSPGLSGFAAGYVRLGDDWTGVDLEPAQIVGVLKAKGTLAGTSDGVATCSATLTAKGTLAGTIAGVATVAGDLGQVLGSGQITGSTDGVAIVSGTLTAKGALAGSTDGVADVSATLKGKGSLTNYDSLVVDLSHYYNMDETASPRRDYIGTNHIYNQSGTQTDNNGILGKCIYFDGSSWSEWNTSFTAGRSEVTVSFWVKPTNTNFAWMFYETYQSGYVQYGLHSGGWYTRDTSTGWNGTRNNDLALPSVTAGVWTHIVLVYSVAGGYKRIYKNAEAPTENTTSVDTLTTERLIMHIGRENEVSSYFYTGRVDEFGVWDRVLSVSEIERLYNSGIGKTYPFILHGFSTVSATLKAKGSLVASSAGVATVSGTLKGKGSLIGITDGVAVISGTLTAKGSIAGATDGVAICSATLTSKGTLAGATDGVAIVSGTLGYVPALIGSTNGVAVVSATLTGWGKLYGSTDGIATVSGSLILGQIVGSTSGVAVVSGNLTAKGTLVGSTDGIATVSATLGYVPALIGSTAGVAVVSGTLKAKGSLAGSTAGIATVSGSLILGQIIGVTSGIAVVSGTLKAKGTLVATTNGVAVVSATLKAKGTLVGATDGVAVVAATLKAKGTLLGSSTGVAVVSATLKGRGQLAGSTSGVATCSATPVLEIFQGSTDGVAVVSGTLKAKGRLYGTSAGVSVVSGTLNSELAFSGSTAGISVVSGTLKGRAALQTATNGVAAVSGRLLGYAEIAGATNGIATVGGTLGGHGDLLGSIVTTATVSGVLHGIAEILGSTAGVATLTGNLVGLTPGTLRGRTDGTATLTGILRGIGKLQGSSAGVGTVAGVTLAVLILEKIEGNSYITILIAEESPIIIKLEGNSFVKMELTENSLIP